MGNIRRPRRGSLQFWPRVRAKHSVARVRTWAQENKAKPLGFLGFKAGMTHLLVADNRPKSMTKGEKIALPSTIIECPPLNVVGICFYKKDMYGLHKIATIMAEKLSKELGRVIQLPKKAASKIEEAKEFDDLRLLVHTSPNLASTEAKKPKMMEIALGGNKNEKYAYAKEMLGREIKVEDVFENGVSVDVHGISKGKGFQGTVKRYGVAIRQHKAEKTKRGIGNLGSWTPKRVQFQVALPGKMGYHLRTEYNKQILKVSPNSNDINPTGGIKNYGVVKNSYLLVKGSVIGPKKRTVLLTKSIRPDAKMVKDGFQVSYVSVSN